MNFASCPCTDHTDDGCPECGYTGLLRRCDTCGDYSAAERQPTREDHDAPWSCPGCWAKCHTIIGQDCKKPVEVEALVWTEDSHPGELGRFAVQMRLCRRCFEMATYDKRIVAGTVRELTKEERTAA